MQEVILHFDKEEDYRTKEAYKTLRTNVEFSGDSLKVVSVTSCTPNEGKSSVAMSLAKAFAEAGQRTLIVDADMRKSVLVGRYKTGAVRQGLTHYLIGRARIEDVICKSNIKNLFLVFSGPVPPNPSELIGGARFAEFMTEARKACDMVIIDTPPLGSVIDAAVAAKHCDGTILVIENNAISYKFAQRVKEQLDVTGCRILGAVLNKVDMSAKSYYGNYGRYYGKYYGKYYGRYGEEGLESRVDMKLSGSSNPELKELGSKLRKAGAVQKERLDTGKDDFKYFL
ncbi:MAG: polysaccharide biosynthesis tyrosine autokinase [Lachnospiraceae bacterium]|nr:polysaccharide biosynthesis tyrosine autokinase [Lachnospiraceae bacterium]